MNMRFIKWMLATALVLDAALFITTSPKSATAPEQSIGFSTDQDTNSTLSTIVR